MCCANIGTIILKEANFIHHLFRSVHAHRIRMMWLHIIKIVAADRHIMPKHPTADNA